MDYIIYTAEGLTKTPNGGEVENCQILDFQYDTNMSKKEAIESYLDNYPIEQSGFKLENIKAEIRIDKETVVAMYDVVKYLWKVEKRHYEESSEDEKGNHIFNQLSTLAYYLDKDYGCLGTFDQ